MSQGSHDSHDMVKHALIMALCCLIPLVALVIIWYMGLSSSTLSALVPLLCPLLMFAGMAFMMRHKKDDKPVQDNSARAGEDGHRGHCEK